MLKRLIAMGLAAAMLLSMLPVEAAAMQKDATAEQEPPAVLLPQEEEALTETKEEITEPHAAAEPEGKQTWISGSVRDSGNAGIENVTVTVLHRATQTYLTTTMKTTPAGEWKIDNAQPGEEYVVSYYKAGYEFSQNRISCTPEKIGTALDVVSASQIPGLVCKAEDYTYTTDATAGTAAITGYTGTDTAILLPEQLGGYPVTQIADQAFQGNTAVQKVALPATVTFIGPYAFDQCSGLEKIWLPNILDELEHNALAACTGLTQVDLPDSVTKIRREVFRDCVGLSDVTIPLCWKEIARHNDRNQSGYIFHGCSSLTKIVVPEGMTELPLRAFDGADYLMQIVLPSTLTKISHFAFYYCGRLSSIELPAAVTEIGDYSFAECVALKNIIFPGNVTSIGFNTFSGCTSLTQVDLPNSVSSIDAEAFEYCENLQSIHLPVSWSYSGGNIFQGCRKLKKISVPEGMTTLPEDAFLSCTDIRTVQLPESLTDIGASAFRWCEMLERVWIGKNVTKIGERAFEETTQLTIHGVEGTYAQTYAQKNQIPFSAEKINFDEVVLKGAVKDEHGAGIGGVDVLVLGYMNGVEEPVHFRTAEDGSWMISDVRKGYSYIVRYYKAGYAFDQERISCVMDQGELTLDAAVARKLPGLTCKAEDYTYTTDTAMGTATITGYTGKATDILLPEQLGGYPVTQIADQAFEGNLTVQKVALPATVTFIGQYAFSSCNNLQKIWMPNQLETIGNNAFRSCTKLMTVSLPDGVKNIGESAFYDCAELTDITIPVCWNSVGDVHYDVGNIFGLCTNLKRITVPEGMVLLPRYAFSGCNHLEEVVLPGTLTKIDKYAFRGCVCLTKVTFPSGLREIEKGAFDSTGLLEAPIPDGVEAIGSSAFANCPDLRSVHIPLQWKTISRDYDDPYAEIGNIFMSCPNLKKITVPEGVVVLPDSAFAGCDCAEEFLLPGTLKEIPCYAFENCTALKKITLPDSIEVIGCRAFAGCTELSSINIPLNWNKVDESSDSGSIFEGCTKLKKIVVPEGITDLPAYAFSGCDTLQEIVLPTTLHKINWKAFLKCTSLQNIVIPNGVTELAESAFAHCYNLEKIELPQTLLSIGRNAFWDCKKLTEIQLPDSVKTIGNQAFWDCSGLKTINIPRQWETSGSSIFSGCSHLTKIYVPEGVTVLPVDAFGYCNYLRYVQLPSSLTQIREDTFSYCKDLERVWIGKNVTTIDPTAFKEDSQLTIHGAEGSYAQSYAQQMKIPFSVEPIDFDRATLSGKVVRRDGTGEQDVSVFVCDLTHNRFEEKNLHTSADGTWSVSDLAAGNRYSVRYGKAGCTFEKAEQVCAAEKGMNLLEPVTLDYIADMVCELQNYGYIINSKNTGATITEYYGSAPKILVPNELGGFPVTSIGEYAFSHHSEIEEIGLPDTLENIGSYAFGDCTGLTRIHLPDNVQSISDHAFNNCVNLAEIKVPLLWNSGDTGIFAGCTKLTKITMPLGMSVLPSYGFRGSDCLKEVVLPETLRCVDYGTFKNCTVMEQITLPETVMEIKSEAFYGCSSLTKIAIPEGVDSINNETFYGCKKMEEISLPVTLKTIGIRAFEDCTALRKVDLPDAVTTISSAAFWGCTALESLKAGKNVTSIESGTFDRCDKLVIRCYSGSYVHQFAEREQIPYVLIDNHEHVFVKTEDVPPTCTRDGVIRYRCSVCGYEYTESFPATGHQFDEWIISRPASYNADGVRTRTCRICGKTERVAIPRLTFDPNNPLYGVAHFTVVHAQTMKPISGAHLCITSPDGQTEETFTTDAQGKVSVVLPVGPNAVSCYDSGCITRNLAVKVEPGENQIPDIGMSELPAYEAKLDSHLMTQDEIVAEGIDIRDVENQHVYRYELKLSFTPTLEMYTLETIKTDKGKILKGSASGDAVWVDQKESGGYFWVPDSGGTKVIPITEYFYLIVRGEIRWQKEMFDVEMLIVNNSRTDTMENVTAELELPEGLSLAAMQLKPQQLLQKIDRIAGGESQSVHWYLRGDQPGSYTLKAHLKGMMMPFEEPIDDVYTAANQLQVWAGDALHLDFEFPNAAYYGKDYPVRISLTNVSDVPLYNITHAVKMIEGMEIYHEDQIAKKKITQGALASAVPVFHPGDKLVIEGSANIFFESEIMEKKIQRMIGVVDGAEFLYSSMNLVRIFAGDITSLSGIITTLCDTLEGMDPNMDETTQEDLETLKDLTKVAKNLRTLLKSKKNKEGATEAGKIMQISGLEKEIEAFCNDPVKWMKSHSKEEIKDFKDKISAVGSLAGGFKPKKSSGSFNIFDSIRTAISSIPVRFCLSEVIMTENPENTADIPWTYHVSPVSAPYYGVSDQDKYIRSLVKAAMGGVYDEVVPNYAHLIPGLDDPLQKDDAIKYIRATESEITRLKAKDATGNITFKVWIETAPQGQKAAVGPASHFELSCDQKDAVMDNGVLTFKGDATIAVRPTAKQNGVLHVQDSNGNQYIYQLDVVPAHKCTGGTTNVLVEPTAEHDGYAVRTCDICGAVVDVQALALKDQCRVHTYGEWVTETESTTEVRGIRSRTCSVCGHTDYEFTDLVHEHTMEKHPGIEPTCTTEGRLEHWHCTVCGRNYSDSAGTRELTEKELVLPKANHQFTNEWKTDAHGHWHECICGARKDMQNHQFTWKVDQPAGPGQPGVKHQVCSICGYAGPETEIPGLPMQTPVLTVSNETSTGKPVLQWTAVEGAQKYEVYLAFSADGAFKRQALVDKTGLVEESVAAGETCYYKVRAISASGMTSDFSEVQFCVCKLAQPVLMVTLRSGKPCLSWTAAHGAVEYEVYHSMNGGEFTILRTISDIQFTHTSALAGNTHAYKVRAVGTNKDGSSAFSEIQQVTLEAIHLAIPELTVTNTASTGKPYLQWNTVDGAAEYEIYYSTAKDGEYIPFYSTSKNSVRHGSAKLAVTYYYKIRAVAADGTEGEWGPTQTRTCDLAQPDVTPATRSDGKPVLTWKAIDGARKYQIYYRTDGGDFQRLITVSGTKLTHSSAKPGHTYTYKVRALAFRSAANSAWSYYDTITVELGVPTLTVTNKSSTGKPYLKWTAVDGAEKYEIYRATSKSGTYTRLTTTGGTRLTNSSTTAGKTYYYKVRAIGTAGTVGDFSAIKTRTCDLARPDVKLTTRNGHPYLYWKSIYSAVKYDVYCSVDGGSFNRLISVKGTHLTHSSAKRGHTYRYRVKAIASKSSANSAYSYYDTITLKK